MARVQTAVQAHNPLAADICPANQLFGFLHWPRGNSETPQHGVEAHLPLAINIIAKKGLQGPPAVFAGDPPVVALKKRVADLVEVSLGEAQLDRPGKVAGVVSKCEGHEAVKHKVQSGRRNYSNLFCVTTAAQRIVHTNAVDKLVPNPRR